MNLEQKQGRKICFVHVVSQKKPEIVRLLPIGMLALADYFKKRGYFCQVIHLGLERSLDPDFDLARYVSRQGYKILLLDLHWHQQIYSVISLAKKLKKRNREVKIILGGFTASFFANEIMDFCKEVDFIIKGDSEKPLESLFKSLFTKSFNFESVDNLVWRKEGRIVCNLQNYVADKRLMSSLCFSNFRLLRNWKRYLLDLSMEPCQGADRYSVFYYVPGRGCLLNCSYCGGSARAQKLINNRRGVVFIDQKSVINELQQIKKYNLDKIYIAFDPVPGSDYYLKLFRIIRKQKLNIRIVFECFNLPTIKFIQEFGKTFIEDRTLVISPESGSKAIRKKNKGLNYTNSQFLDIVRFIVESDIGLQVAFTAGLEGEGKPEVKETLKLIAALKNKFKRKLEFNIEAIESEPGALGLTKKKLSFGDYYYSSKQAEPLICANENLSIRDIKAIIELYRAESKCIYDQSWFLRFLLDYSGGDVNFSFLSRKCKKCSNYSHCFYSKQAKGP